MMNEKQIEAALKLALEALEHEADIGNDNAYQRERDAIREALMSVSDGAQERSSEEQPAQQDYWQEEARRYAQNAEFWRGKYEAATAQQQEPVAWVSQANLNSAAIQRNRGGQGDTHTWSETPTWDHSVPLYISPQPSKPWMGLTDDDIQQVRENCGITHHAIKTIEAKLREKNT